MNTFSIKKFSFSRFKIVKTLIFPVLFLFCTICLFSSCKKEIDYFNYVSELRNNIFLAQTDEYSLRVYSVIKESPYAADGIPRETSARTEIYLTAPSGDKTYELTFTVNGETYGGELSYDNVRGEYYYSRTLDISKLTELDCTLICDTTQTQIKATSVLDPNTLSPQTILSGLVKTEAQLFNDMTDDYGFTGEIYIRLIYEDAPYYYVGVINRSGCTNAFLLNAYTGKILAKRQS